MIFLALVDRFTSEQDLKGPTNIGSTYIGNSVPLNISPQVWSALNWGETKTQSMDSFYIIFLVFLHLYKNDNYFLFSKLC